MARSAVWRFWAISHSFGSGTRRSLRLRERELVVEILLERLQHARDPLRSILREHAAQRRPEQLLDGEPLLRLAREHAGVAAGHGGDEGARNPAAAAAQPVGHARPCLPGVE